MAKNDVTSTSSTTPNNPAINNTITKLLGGVDKAYDAGPNPFPESLYAGVGPTTQKGWTSALTAANNPLFKTGTDAAMNYSNNLVKSGGLTGGMAGDIADARAVSDKFGALADTYRKPGLYETTMMGTAQGKNLNGQDPAFQRDLKRTLDTAGAGVNASIGAGGRYGSGMHVDTLGKTLAGVSDSALLGERRYQNDRQQQALTGIGSERQTGIANQANALGARTGAAGQAFGMQQQGVANAIGAGNNLSDIYQSSLLPSTITGSVGSSQDANKQASLMGRADLWDRTKNAQPNFLAQLSSVLNGQAQASGSTTTNTQPGTPWWQTAISLAGQFV